MKPSTSAPEKISSTSQHLTLEKNLFWLVIYIIVSNAASCLFNINIFCVLPMEAYCHTPQCSIHSCNVLWLLFYVPVLYFIMPQWPIFLGLTASEALGGLYLYLWKPCRNHHHLVPSPARSADGMEKIRPWCTDPWLQKCHISSEKGSQLDVKV